MLINEDYNETAATNYGRDGDKHQGKSVHSGSVTFKRAYERNTMAGSLSVIFYIKGPHQESHFTGLSWEDDYVVLVQVPLKNIYRRTIHHLWVDHVNNDQQRLFILWCQQVLSIIWWLVLSATFLMDICQLTSFIMDGSCQQQAATFIALEPILSTNTAWLPGNNERLLQVDHISDKQQLLYFFDHQPMCASLVVIVMGNSFKG